MESPRFSGSSDCGISVVAWKRFDSLPLHRDSDVDDLVDEPRLLSL